MIMDFLLENFTKENYPMFNMEKCICKIYSNRSQCMKCIDICPVNAIDWVRGKLTIDKDLCNSCGLCKSTCTTYSINIKGFGEENVLRGIESKSNIIFSCSNVECRSKIRQNFCVHQIF